MEKANRGRELSTGLFEEGGLGKEVLMGGEDGGVGSAADGQLDDRGAEVAVCASALQSG